MVTHVVMFRFTDPRDIDEAIGRLRGMVGQVAGLKALRVGRNQNSGSSAFELVLITEHESFEDLSAYAADPRHQEVLAWMAERVADRAVVDTDDLA